ncbi:MAG: histidine kinase [Cyclobacteriaceae bacterium]
MNKNEKTHVYLSIKVNEQYRHLLVWGLVWIFMVSGGIEIGWPIWFSIWTQSPYVILMGITFYFTFFKVCPLLHINRTILILNHLLIGILFIVIYILLNHTIPEYETLEEGRGDYLISWDIIDSLPLLSIVWIFAYGLYYSKRGITLAHINNRKALQLAEKQKQLVRQELQFYKSQFNAHLTFNTLSHIYAQVIDQEEAAQSVLLLSDILRYNTAAKADCPVNLDAEIIYLQNFIRIHQIIYPQLHIRFSSEGNTHRFEILPRILVSFVENAIKHGTGNDPDYPISITLRVDERLEFKIINRISRTAKVKSTRLGLDITRQTLNSFYGPLHSLEIKQTDDMYQVHLIIISSSEKKLALAG